MFTTLRIAAPADLDAINAIYNHYVLHSTCTYQEEITTPDERSNWFHSHGPRYPITVATTDHGEIVGWASLSPFHPRSAYRHTVEDSIYVRHDSQRRGIGKALLTDLINRARALDYRNIIAIISADQTPSIALHRAHGFEECGVLKQVGLKFDRWLDVLYMQRLI